jgi:hypothetical protein
MRYNIRKVFYKGKTQLIGLNASGVTLSPIWASIEVSTALVTRTLSMCALQRELGAVAQRDGVRAHGAMPRGKRGGNYDELKADIH